MKSLQKGYLGGMAMSVLLMGVDMDSQLLGSSLLVDCCAVNIREGRGQSFVCGISEI